MIPFIDLMSIASAAQNSTSDPWWPASLSGMIGGLGGGAAGLWGATLGVTAGILVPKGKGKLAIRILVYPIALIGLAALIVGFIGWRKDQPYGVWYPLVLLGAILTIQIAWIAPFLEFTLRKVEKRKLEAEELRRS